MGFLNPRVPDDREKHNYRHIHYDSNPNFVNIANLNEINTADWEIHPAYRSYLIQKKTDDASIKRGKKSWFSK